MDTTVHIVNGNSTAEILRKTSIVGDIIVWREALCEGPLLFEVGSDEFWQKRQQFFYDNFKVDKLKYHEITIKEITKIEKLIAYKEVVLWFEYDLFCQVNLMALCTYLLKNYKPSIQYHLICVGKEEVNEDWKTLADYSLQEYVQLYKSKTRIIFDDLQVAERYWKLYCENDKEKMVNFQLEENTIFKYFQLAIEQHVKRFPDANGLNQIDYKILEVINNTALYERDIIKEMLIWQHRETVYGFGDLQYSFYLKKLKDFYFLKDEKMYLNEKGKNLIISK